MDVWNHSLVLFLAVLVLTIPACSDAPKPLEPTLPSIQRNVFDVHCARVGCHVGAAPESGLNLERGRAYAQLINQPSLGIRDVLRVEPGHAARSYLIRKLEGRQIVGERMPMGADPLPDSVLAVIRQWIDRGAGE